MLNALTEYLRANSLSETDAMNQLQDEGIVSDNCVTAEDVAAKDCPAAVGFLEVPF